MAQGSSGDGLVAQVMILQSSWERLAGNGRQPLSVPYDIELRPPRLLRAACHLYLPAEPGRRTPGDGRERTKPRAACRTQSLSPEKKYAPRHWRCPPSGSSGSESAPAWL